MQMIVLIFENAWRFGSVGGVVMFWLSFPITIVAILAICYIKYEIKRGIRFFRRKYSTRNLA